MSDFAILADYSVGQFHDLIIANGRQVPLFGFASVLGVQEIVPGLAFDLGRAGIEPKDLAGFSVPVTLLGSDVEMPDAGF